MADINTTEFLTKPEHEVLCSLNTQKLLSRLQGIEKELSKNSERTDELNKRLYKDNGTSSIQTVLNNQDASIKVLRSDIETITSTMKWLSRTLIGTTIIFIFSLVTTLAATMITASNIAYTEYDSTHLTILEEFIRDFTGEGEK